MNFEDEWHGSCHVLNQISNSIPVICCMGALFRGTFSEKRVFFACTPEADVIFAYFCKNSAKVLCNSFTQLGLQ